tara:strand:- start:409 stop:669 length:261 start_codon:yes stop_codon:yes gene_type:complete
MLTITVGFDTYGGVGTRQGSQQTLRRFLSQCDNAGGVIEIDGAPVSLEAAETAYAAQLDDVIAGAVRCVETGIANDAPGTFTIQLA